MKNRASFVLVEQLIMLLVFALAAAICLQVFVKADGISQKTVLQDNAVILAQNSAEAVKAAKGDLETAAQHLDAQVNDGILILTADGLQLQIVPEASDLAGLGKARVTVSAADSGEPLFSLTTGWQEVAP